MTGYRVERCQGAGCTTFAQVGDADGDAFSDTGLTASTSYSYRVRAMDAAREPRAATRAIVAATTPAAADTTPPSAPTSLAATAVELEQVNLTWTASTDNVGVTGYRVERCQGAGCTTFAQVRHADRHDASATPGSSASTRTGIGCGRRTRPGIWRVQPVVERDDAGGARHDAADGADEPGRRRR